MYMCILIEDGTETASDTLAKSSSNVATASKQFTYIDAAAAFSSGTARVSTYGAVPDCTTQAATPLT